MLGTHVGVAVLFRSKTVKLTMVFQVTRIQRIQAASNISTVKSHPKVNGSDEFLLSERSTFNFDVVRDPESTESAAFRQLQCNRRLSFQLPV
jgi:hypothetical protein